MTDEQKEKSTGAKSPDRREFLKRGAALAGGLSLGTVESAIGQTPSSGGKILGTPE